MTQHTGNISARSHHTARSQNSTTNPEKFTKLKSVLVNNLLKYYHKRMQRQGNDEVYRRAVEEVEKILAQGKLTDKHLQDLQRQFAREVIEEPSAVKPPPTGSSAPPQTSGGVGGENVRGEVGGAVESTNGSPSKRKKVDEWSVMTLYDDVRHYEEQRELKARLMQDKLRNRTELAAQIDDKKRRKEQEKEAERAAAQEQQRRFEEWEKEKVRSGRLKMEKAARERREQDVLVQMVEQKRKVEAEERMREEQQAMVELKKMEEQDKKEKEQLVVRKQEAYHKFRAENERGLVRKKEIKAQERQEDERLFQVQISMAERQERIRADREAERQAKVKATERIAGELNNRAQELERQIEERVRVAQEQQEQREREKDRQKAERKARIDRETNTYLQEQIRGQEAVKERLKEEDRQLLQQLKREAELNEAQKEAQWRAKRDRERQVRETLDQQLLVREALRGQEAAMSEVEMRLNANLLKKVVNDRTGAVPEDMQDVIHLPEHKESKHPKNRNH